MARGTLGARVVSVLAMTAAVLGLAVPLANPAGAGSGNPQLSQFVLLVKDQAGGAYYNVTTGERFDAQVTEAVPAFGNAGIQVTSGLILAIDGELYAPINDLTTGTPAASVVQLVESDAGTWQDTATGLLYEAVAPTEQLPADNAFALKVATNLIIMVNGDVILPVQRATGLNDY